MSDPAQPPTLTVNGPEPPAAFPYKSPPASSPSPMAWPNYEDSSDEDELSLIKKQVSDNILQVLI